MSPGRPASQEVADGAAATAAAAAAWAGVRCAAPARSGLACVTRPVASRSRPGGMRAAVSVIWTMRAGLGEARLAGPGRLSR